MKLTTFVIHCEGFGGTKPSANILLTAKVMIFKKKEDAIAAGELLTELGAKTEVIGGSRDQYVYLKLKNMQ